MSQKYDIHNSDIPVLCRSCEARHKGICGVLSPDQLIRLSKQTSKHNLEAGQEVLKGSEPNERYANILKGVVKLTKLTSDGRQQIVGLQFAPDFLGRPFGRQTDVSVEASTDVKVCSFPRRALEAMMLEAPELEHKLHEQALREYLPKLVRKTPKQKLTREKEIELMNSYADENPEELLETLSYQIDW